MDSMPKHPCQGCVYYKACGSSTRTEPCYGRKTKRDRVKENERRAEITETDSE